MSIHDLGEFIQYVPSCSETGSVSCLESLFEAGMNSTVVIIDDNNHPQGIIQLRSWLTYQAQVNQRSIDRKTNTFDDLRTIDTLISPIFGEPFCLKVNPIGIAQLNWTLTQFLYQIRDQSHQGNLFPHEELIWVVVNAHGQYLGVLNEQAVWQKIALHEYSYLSKPASSPKNNLVRNTYSSQQLINQSIELRNSASSEFSTPNGTFNNILVEVLNSIPVALMLQTEGGQVVMQNQAWQTYVGNLQEPNIIRNQIAQLFEHQQLIDDTYSSLKNNPVCHLGHGSDECICSCVMTDGDDCTWKITRFPFNFNSINTIFSQTKQERYSAIASPRSLSELGSFRFARQGFNSHSISNNVNSPNIDSLRGARGHLSRDIQSSDTLWFVMAEDITSSHEVTQALQERNKRLQVENRSKDEFLNYITHSLKTPLTALLGLSSLLKNQAIGTLNDRQTQYAQLIYKSGRQLVSMVNMILDLSQFEMNEIHVNVELIDIQDVQAICEQSYKDAIELQNYERFSKASHSSPISEIYSSLENFFSLSIQPGLQYAMADPFRLKQMLVHLLSIALNLSDLSDLEEGNQICLSIQLWNRWLSFTVMNQCKGIPLEKQDGLLENQYFSKNFYDHLSEETGLRLSLVQKLAELHGGDISFTSEPGGKSDFTILLPYLFNTVNREQKHTETLAQDINTNSWKVQGLAASSEAIARSNKFQSISASYQRKSSLILVAASSIRIAQIIPEIYQKDYDVIVARTETEAMNKLRRFHPRVTIVDLTDSSFSGSELTAAAKDDPAVKHIPIVGITDDCNEQSVKDLNVDALLQYPIHAEDLQQYLQCLITSPDVSDDISKQITVLYFNPKIFHHSDESSDALADLEEYKNSIQNTSSSLHSNTSSPRDLSRVLQLLPWKVIEVDDISQAVLLGRVWEPDVILFDHQITDYINLLQAFDNDDYLSTLPLITFTPEHTEAANRLENLTVFPCLQLNLDQHDVQMSKTMFSPLTEVIRIASGMQQTPQIVVASLDVWGQSSQTNQSELVFDIEHQHALQMISSTDEENSAGTRLSAFIQYLQTAGIQVIVGLSPNDIDQKLSQPGHSLLLLYSPLPHPNFETLKTILKHLRVQNAGLSILLWVDMLTHKFKERGSLDEDSLIQLSQTFGIEIISGALSMNDVLSAVRRSIAQD